MIPNFHENKKASTLVNKTQVGGDHYKTKFEPWDLIIEWRIPFLEANIIKYVTRYKLKNGVADLEKARHYFDKLIETLDWSLYSWDDLVPIPEEVLAKYAIENRLTFAQVDLITAAVNWTERDDVVAARDELEALIEIERRAA
jgi:hypothetical protein